MKKKKMKAKKGAASFYVVAFSTLILIVLATSFAAIIISEVTRTSNDDLSQSAYDSALAGVEEAKLAYYNYENCRLNRFQGEACVRTRENMQNPNCDMVNNMLGRENGEIVENNTGGNNMEQAYTCVKLYDLVKDYRSTLSSADMIDVVNTKFIDDDIVNKISKVKISWYSSENESNFAFSNFSSGRVPFHSLAGGDGTSYAAPPTISLAMMQTGSSFDINSFENVSNGQTNRGMVYLVPTDDATAATNDGANNYIGAYNGSENYISASEGFVKSNDRNATNLPFAVKCAESAASMTSGYACSATIEIPKPIDGVRSNDNFVFVVGLPYGKPMTDFALEFFCNDGVECNKGYTGDFVSTEEIETENISQAYLSGVQVLVDSTGRANDLYRRVEARLDNARSEMALSIMGPLEILIDDGSADTEGMRKNLIVTSEYNF